MTVLKTEWGGEVNFHINRVSVDLSLKPENLSCRNKKTVGLISGIVQHQRPDSTVRIKWVILL